MKKSVSLLLSLLMVISIITSMPVSVSAASIDDLTFELSSSGKSYYVSDCKTSVKGEIVIPSTYKGKSVTRIGDGAFYDCISLESIKIPDSVTKIGEWAFADCRSLFSIIIPGSVESIGDGAFNYSSLTSITIPDSVKSIGEDAFGWCSSLRSVTIGKGVTSVGEDAFYYCDNLSKVNTEDLVGWCKIDFDGYYSNPLSYAKNFYIDGELVKNIVIPDGVKSIGDGAFYGYQKLESIKIPDSVKSIGEGAFAGCKKLSKVNIEDIAAWCKIDFEDYDSNPLYFAKNLYINGNLAKNIVIPNGVKKIGKSVFEGCKSIESITISDSVTSISYSAFSRCTSLKSATIGNGVTSIGNSAFYNCTSLASIIIPDSVESIDRWAFFGCTSLTSIKIPDSVTRIDKNAFSNCTSLKSATIGNGVTIIDEQTFAACTNLESIRFSDNLKIIGAYAFQNCKSLKSVKFPDSITSIDKYAFYKCTSLESIRFSDSLKIIGACAFDYCKSLKSIKIPDSVISIGIFAFDNCTSLESVTIGKGVTRIGESAFYKCTNLEEIYWNAKNVSDFSGSKNVFYNAGAKSSGIKVIFGDSVERIPANVFKNVKKVTSITIPDTVKSIGYLAFYNTGYYNNRSNWDKSALYIGNHLIRAKTSLKGDYNIKKSTKTIADKAFLNRENITSISIPSSVRNIGKNAFRSCKNITSITIPDTVKSIGYLAFYDTGYYNNRKNWDKSALYIGNHLIRARHSLTGDYQVKEGTITIADMAFRDCDNLTSVEFPSSVKNIGKNIFYKCDNIKG